MYRINNRFIQCRKKDNEFEDVAIETIQNEIQRDKRLEVKMNKESLN